MRHCPCLGFFSLAILSSLCVLCAFVQPLPLLAQADVSTIAGNGIAGQSGNGGPAVDAALNSPVRLALSPAGKVLYIADQGGSVWRALDLKSGVIYAEASDIVRRQILAAATDRFGNSYSVDGAKGLVRKINGKGGAIETIAGGGRGCAAQSDPLGDGCLAMRVRLNAPYDVAVDSEENLYISDRADNVVRRVDAKSGVITLFAGKPGSFGYSGDGEEAAGAELYEPRGLALDALGNLYIADSRNGRIRRVDGGSGIITTIAGGDAAGVNLRSPRGLALDRLNNLYIADAGNNVVLRVELAPLQAAGETDSVAAHLSAVPATTAPLTPTATPIIKPATGSYSVTQTVTITAAAGATIYYTTDRYTPVPEVTSETHIYTGPFIIAKDTWVKAIATKQGCTQSAMASSDLDVVGTPWIIDSPVTNITASSATLNAQEVNDDQTANVYFVYGTSSKAMSAASVTVALTAKSTNQLVSITISNLKSNTTYWYQPVSSALGGTAYGAIASFKTK